jgi:hypothetical protein
MDDFGFDHGHCPECGETGWTHDPHCSSYDGPYGGGGGYHRGGHNSNGPGCGTYILALVLIFIAMLIGGDTLAALVLLGFFIYGMLK